MRFDPVPIIKDRLTMREVIERYGFETDRRNKIICPFHNEKTASMKIYDISYYCFGCHASGDVIKFVKTLFNLSFPETLKKIDVDFNLSLFERVSERKALELARKNHKIKKQIQDKKQEKENLNNKYWDAFDEWKRLADNKIKYAPKTQDEELHPLFIEALKKLEQQLYLLECIESEVYEYEHRVS